jgi:penicillin-binding protein 1A
VAGGPPGKTFPVPVDVDATDEERAPTNATARPLDADARWSKVALALLGVALSFGVGARRAFWRMLEETDLAAAALGRRVRSWVAEREAHWDRKELRPGTTREATLRTIGTAVAIVTLLAGALVAGGRATMSGLSAGTSTGDADEVDLPPLAQRSELFAADGSSLGVVHGDDGNRVVVPLEVIPQVVIDAVVATEDADYWNHDGIDMSGVARAAKRNVDVGGVAEGGSTITQQLAKSTMEAPERDLHRKVTEAVLAVRLDDQLGKRGVLERYLNTIFFGQGAYGIAAAAEAYFGRAVGELTADQAALLAGLIRGPNLYDPITKPEAAAARRATVLDQMVAEGLLAPADADAAKQAPLPETIHRPAAATGWVADAARSELLADPRLGRTPEARAAAVAGGGLRIHTTVDPALQQQAQEAVKNGIPGGTDVTAALASVDPATGAVRALVGGGDYGANQFNAARDGAGRQTGSAFKVFTLVAALRAGHVSSEPIDGNSPCPIPNPGGTPDPWLPENYEGHTFGALTLADATAQSSNCAFARLASSVGVDAVARTAQEMGIQAPLQPVPSMTLGTSSVPPLQMAAAYATLAADGVARTPHVVARVEGPDGRVLLENDGAPRPVLDPQVARVATSVLGGVVTRGTGKAAALPDRPVAGKTGTAQDYQDAWFVGYTPQLATAVWMGDVNGERPMRGIGGIDVTGGSYPARIWRQFMAAAHAGLPVMAFPAPAPEPPPTAAVTAPAPDADAGSGAGGRKPKGGKGKRKD